MTSALTKAQVLSNQIRYDIDSLERELVQQQTNDENEEEEEATLHRHPLGVRPGGNALTSDQDLSLSMGIFGRAPDALVLLLLEFLDARALFNIGQTCRGLFAYSAYDQLWRDIALREDSNNLNWHGTWRQSLLKGRSALPRVDCRYLFSDALYRPFQCTYSPLAPYFSNIPTANQIARFRNLNSEQFSRDWSHRPFILTEPVKTWRCFREWDEVALLNQYKDVRFRAEAVDWTLSNYVQYMNENKDESPLYLFDRAFVEKMGIQLGPDGAYNPPTCFGQDFFTLLGEHRPDHRWLIIGPARSGSTFHKDPNATSAWNAVIRGSKYWIMFPNSITPPGVYVSDDQGEVTSPLSIVEWLLSFHAEARQIPGCVEGICREGEVLHVPSGWWHLVVNLESAIAITQNFVPESHLAAAVKFLRNKPDQVSGFRETVRDPSTLFLDRLQAARPDLYDGVQSLTSKRKWDEVVAATDEAGRASRCFSFGFGVDLEEE